MKLKSTFFNYVQLTKIWQIYFFDTKVASQAANEMELTLVNRFDNLKISEKQLPNVLACKNESMTRGFLIKASG